MEELEGKSDDVITTELDIELTERDTASKVSQSLTRITAVTRGAFSCDSREVHKCCMCSSDRTAGLAWFFIYLCNRAAATSALRFPMNGAHCISENKVGTSPGIFLGLFHCCRVSVKFCPLE